MNERDGLSLVMGIEHKCIPKSNNRTRAITAIIDGVENTLWITINLCDIWSSVNMEHK